MLQQGATAAGGKKGRDRDVNHTYEGHDGIGSTEHHLDCHQYTCCSDLNLDFSLQPHLWR